MRINKLVAAGAVLAAVASGGALTATAWAAPRVPAGSLAVHSTGSVKLGHLPSGLAPGLVTESPSGTVYFVKSKNVYRVRGNHAPVLVLTASTPVLAVAASRSDLYIETGKTVIEVDLARGVSVRHWHVSSPFAVTQAGLFIAGRTLWSWTDWETDSSGFEWATVSRISIGSSAVHKVTAKAFPDEYVAGSAGLYLTVLHHNRADLALATPAGRLLIGKEVYPLTLWRHYVLTLAGTVTGPKLQWWTASTLRLVGHSLPRAGLDSVADGSAGLVALTDPCGHASCTSVGLLDPPTGRVSQRLKLPGATQLVQGPRSAVIAVNSHGTAYLSWLAG
jgi:hypothetical protein